MIFINLRTQNAKKKYKEKKLLKLKIVNIGDDEEDVNKNLNCMMIKILITMIFTTKMKQIKQDVEYDDKE